MLLNWLDDLVAKIVFRVFIILVSKMVVWKLKWFQGLIGVSLVLQLALLIGAQFSNRKL